jgi:serine phosphatase RsbU (regulator of sigma subunit)
LTDGVAEAGSRAGAAFRAERAVELVRACRDEPARGIVERLHAAVREHCRDGAQADDVTAVVIKAGPAA